jgi:hypothetical protein
MLTAFVLGSTATGGILVLSMPLAFASLLTLRYSRAHRRKEAARGDELSAGQPSRMPKAPSRSGSGGGLRTASSSFRSRTAGQALSLSRPASAHPASALRPRSGSASRASSRPHTRVPTRGPGVSGQSRRSAGS